MSASAIHGDRILEGSNIRLLCILPASDYTSQVHCDCTPFELDDAPAYEALSYVWGDQTHREEIIVNGKSMQVGIQLNHALRRLRQQSASRLVWVDAICINQNDNEEKSCQVRLMGIIYSQAIRVVVWLGNEDHAIATDATATTRYIAKACAEYRTENQAEHDKHRFRSHDLPIERFGSGVCSNLKKLFDCTWFRRVWCIQEISLAQDAVVLYGDQQLPWTSVGIAASWIVDHIAKSGDNSALASALDEISSMNASVLYDRDVWFGRALLRILVASLTYESTNPRDKVYGLLNLVYPREEVEALQVDYNKSVEQVFADTVLVYIRLHSRLNTMGHVHHSNNYDGGNSMRSWTPDWIERRWILPLEPPFHNQWSACGDELVKVVDDACISYHHLKLSGILYGTVTVIEEIMNRDSLYYKRGEEHPFVALFNNINFDPRPEYWVQFFKLADTIGAGEFYEAFNSSQEDLQKFGWHVMDVLTWLDDPTKSYDDVAKDLDPAARKIFHTAVTTCSGRRVFFLQDGSLGLGPACMRLGDIVAVLYGSDAPCVLRPRGDNYLFLGLAYIDDIMHGELVEDMRARRRSEQEFCLI